MVSSAKRHRRGKRRTPPTTAEVARKALSLARANAAAVEVKKFDINGITNIDDAGLSFNLAPLSKGTDDDDRIGSRVTAKRVQVNLTARPSSGATGGATFVRVVIACKRAPGNWDSSTYFEKFTGAEKVTSLRTFDNMSHYKTLYDKVHELDGGPSAQLSGAHDSISIAVPQYLSEMQWDGVGNHEKNSLWLFITSNQATATAASVQYMGRCMFTDA